MDIFKLINQWVQAVMMNTYKDNIEQLYYNKIEEIFKNISKKYIHHPKLIEITKGMLVLD